MTTSFSSFIYSTLTLLRKENEASQYTVANHQNFALHNFTEEQKDNFYINFLQLTADISQLKKKINCTLCRVSF